MAGLTGYAPSYAFAYSAAATANVLVSLEYYGAIVVENDTGVNVWVTTDGSNAPTGVGAAANALMIPPNTQWVFGNLLTMTPPNWNNAKPNTNTEDVGLSGLSPAFTGNTSPVSGTNQSAYNGTAYATYTSTFASPAVFTSKTIAALGNNTVVTIGSAGIQGGNFTALQGGAGTPIKPYFVVGTSGNTFNLATTSGGTGANGDGATTGSGNLNLVKTYCAITPTANATGNINITFQ